MLEMFSFVGRDIQSNHNNKSYHTLTDQTLKKLPIWFVCVCVGGGGGGFE